MLHQQLALFKDWELVILFLEAFGLLLHLLVTQAQDNHPGCRNKRYSSGKRDIMGQSNNSENSPLIKYVKSV